MFPTDNCPQSRQCCRSPFRRSPRWTSACPWRMRSYCGSSTTETWAVPARRPPPPRHTPSACSHLVAQSSSPAPPSHPDNDGLPLPGSRLLLDRAVPLESRAILLTRLETQHPGHGSMRMRWTLLIFAVQTIEKWQCCTEALNKRGHLVLCLSCQMGKKEISGLVCNDKW